MDHNGNKVMIYDLYLANFLFISCNFESRKDDFTCKSDKIN